MLGKVEHLIMCKRKAPSFCATHINKRFDRLIIRMTEAQADLPVVRSFNPQAPARPLLTSNALCMICLQPGWMGPTSFAAEMAKVVTIMVVLPLLEHLGEPASDERVENLTNC
eukprot:s641_g13.t1